MQVEALHLRALIFGSNQRIEKIIAGIFPYLLTCHQAIGMLSRTHTEHITQQVPVAFFTNTVNRIHTSSERNMLINSDIYYRTQVVACIFLRLNHTIFEIIAARETVFHSFRATNRRQAMVCHKGRTGHSIQPIEILTFFHCLQFGRVGKNLLVSLINIVGRSATGSLSCQLHIFVTGHHVGQVCIRSHTNITVIGNFRLTSLPSFSRYNDYTVCTTGTINSRCRSILQDVNLFNIVRIDKIQITAGNSVNDNQRRRRGSDRVDTTNLYIIPSTRFVIRTCDGHTGQLSLQRTCGVRFPTSKQSCIGDRSDRTSQVGLLHRAVTYHHYFVQ